MKVFARNRVSSALFAAVLTSSFWSSISEAEATNNGLNTLGWNNLSAEDQTTLTAIYDATGGPDWNINQGWVGNQVWAVCYGVFTTCDDPTVPILTLGLSQNNLIGGVPPEIGDLESLRTLTLAGNSLEGPLPGAIANLSNLDFLELQQNELTDITVLDSLPSLTYVDVRRNLINIQPGSPNRTVIDNLIARGVEVHYEPQNLPSSIVVDHNVDVDDGNTTVGNRSLREAIALAVVRAEAQPLVPVRVTVPARTYHLDTPIDFVIPVDGIIEIVGEGESARITGNAGIIECSGVGSSAQLTLAFLEFSGDGGGAIKAEQTLLLAVGCRFEDCVQTGQVGFGGAIEAGVGAGLIVTACEFVNCWAGSGGAIWIRQAVSLLVTDSEFTNCAAAMDGGAIGAWHLEDDIEIWGCHFFRCAARKGAGINIMGDGLVADSSFVGNKGDSVRASSGVDGFTVLRCLITLSGRDDDLMIAGVYADGGDEVNVVATTIAFNLAQGIVAVGSDVNISHCTIARNTGFRNGSESNVGVDSRSGIVEIENSIVASNAIDFEGGGIRSKGHNLVAKFPGPEFTPVNTDLVPQSEDDFINPHFGRIVGRALSVLPQSRAIDAGDPAFTIDPALFNETDGRGAPRIQDGRVDIGAFEADRTTLRSILEVFFDDATLESTGLAQVLADDQDGDLRSTTEELASGTNASVADAPNDPKPQLGSLILEFQLNERLEPFTYHLEGSLDLETWWRGASYLPLGPGNGFERTASPDSEFVSAVQEGAIWTIRERILPPTGGDPAALFGRLAFEVDLDYGLGGPDVTGTTELIFDGSFTTAYGARVDAMTVGDFTYGGSAAFTPNIDAFYGTRAPLRKATSGYGDLTNVLYSPGGIVEIFLVADVGKRVRLERFNLAAFGPDFDEDPTIDRVEVLYGDGSPAFVQTDVTISETTHTRFDFGGTAIEGQFLIIRFDARNLGRVDDAIAIDDVRFSQVDSSAASGDSTLLIFEKGTGSGTSYGRRVDAAVNGVYRYGGAPGFTPNINFARSGSGLIFRNFGFGDLHLVMTGHTLELRFTADPGYEVWLDRFDLAALDALFETDPIIDLVEVVDGDDNVLFSSPNASISETAHTRFDFGGTRLQAAELVIRIDAQNLGASESPIGIDNVLFGQVPDP